MSAFLISAKLDHRFTVATTLSSDIKFHVCFIQRISVESFESIDDPLFKFHSIASQFTLHTIESQVPRVHFLHNFLIIIRVISVECEV